MMVTFEEQYLCDLYEKGKTNDKKHRFQPYLIEKYKERMDTLKKAQRIEDLFLLSFLRYEVLQGEKKDISSIRVNDPYRVEFTVDKNDMEDVLAICNIIDLSSHDKKIVMITLQEIDPGMIANNLTPFQPTHPGSLVKDELEFRHISQTRFSQKLGLPNSAFNEILNGKRPVTTDFALLMEAALNIPASMLMGLQTDYNLQVARNDRKLLAQLAEVRKLASCFNFDKFS